MPQTKLANIYPAMIIALAGGATWATLTLFADFPQLWGFWNMIRLTTACAFVGGVIAAPLFGRAGWFGGVVAAIGAVLATAIGSALAVSVVEAPQAMVFGPIFVLSSLVFEPTSGGIWILLMGAAHLAAAQSLSPESSG